MSCVADSKVAESAAQMISAPPSSNGFVTVPAPSSKAEPEANTTSVSITTDVALTDRRDAPYCKAMLLATKQPLIPNTNMTHDAVGAGGQRAGWCSDSVAASVPATIMPPMNIASARLSSE